MCDSKLGIEAIRKDLRNRDLMQIGEEGGEDKIEGSWETNDGEK